MEFLNTVWASTNGWVWIAAAATLWGIWMFLKGMFVGIGAMVEPLLQGVHGYAYTDGPSEWKFDGRKIVRSLVTFGLGWLLTSIAGAVWFMGATAGQ